MKALSLIAALMLGTTTLAHAGPLGLPDHQQNGFRDTGCDEDQRVQVPGPNYFNNPTCKSSGGGSNGAVIDALTPDPVDAEPEEPEEPIDCKDCELAAK